MENLSVYPSGKATGPNLTGSSKRLLPDDNSSKNDLKRPKKSYRDVSSDVRVRVLLKGGGGPLTDKDCDHIMTELDVAIVEEEEALPSLKATFLFQQSEVRVICSNHQSAVWTKKFISGMPGPEDGHPGYEAYLPEDSPRVLKFYVWADGDRDYTRFARLIEKGNPGLGFDAKKFHIKAVMPGKGGNTVLFGVEEDMVPCLEAVGYRPLCGFHRVNFKRPDKGRNKSGGNVPFQKEAKPQANKPLPEEEKTDGELERSLEGMAALTLADKNGRHPLEWENVDVPMELTHRELDLRRG